MLFFTGGLPRQQRRTDVRTGVLQKCTREPIHVQHTSLMKHVSFKLTDRKCFTTDLVYWCVLDITAKWWSTGLVCNNKTLALYFFVVVSLSRK